MSAADDLGRLLVQGIQAAAETAWFRSGTLAATSPPMVNVDGVALPVGGVVGALPSVGSPVVVGVLRGLAGVNYVLIGAPGSGRWRTNYGMFGTPGVAASEANTGGANGDAFDDVSTYGDGSITFDDTHGPVYKVYQGPVAGYEWLEWAIWNLDEDPDAAAKTCSGRADYYFPEFAGDEGLRQILDVSRLGDSPITMWITSAGGINVTYPDPLVSSPDGVLPLDQWCSIGWAFDFTGGSDAGSYRVEVYTSATDSTPSWSTSGTWTWEFGTPCIGSRWGNSFGFEVGTYWLRNIRTRDITEIPGPA